MARVNAVEYQEKQARRLKASTEDIKKGIMRVKVAPGKAAAAAKERMKAAIIEAIDNGTWERKVAGVSLEEWQKAFIDKGVNRIAAGIDAAKDKTIASAEKLLANVDKAVAEVDKMPKGTIDDSIARMTTYARTMNELSKKG